MLETVDCETVACPVCAVPFVAQRAGHRYRTCGKARCAREWRSRRLRGTVPAAAVRAKKAQHDRALRDHLRARFGELSVREIELFRFIWRDAYNRGYLKAYHAKQRRTA